METLQSTAGGDTLPVADATAIVKGSVDDTKLVRIEADGLTTSTTRVIIMPDNDVDLGVDFEPYGKGRPKYIEGLVPDYTSSTSCTIGAGSCTASDGSTRLVMSASLTKTINAAWVAGTGGGHFGGTASNSIALHLWLIEKDSDGSIDAGWDNATAPNIPAGYTAKRRIDSVKSGSSGSVTFRAK